MQAPRKMCEDLLGSNSSCSPTYGALQVRMPAGTYQRAPSYITSLGRYSWLIGASPTPTVHDCTQGSYTCLATPTDGNGARGRSQSMHHRTLATASAMFSPVTVAVGNRQAAGPPARPQQNRRPLGNNGKDNASTWWHAQSFDHAAN
jgi:hypothetical protein